LDFVQPNPGYGHPVRPEYVLTDRGGLIGPDCLWLVEWMRGREIGDECLRKWPLPVLLAIGVRCGVGEKSKSGTADGARFGEIAAILLGVSPRALSMAMDVLVDADLVRREVIDGRPPGTRYHVDLAGLELLPSLRRLAAACEPE